MAERIVLFGGTFDPVHHAHLIVAREVAERCGFDRVVLVPAATPPHKDAARASGRDRLAMLRRAVKGEELFEVSPIELRRRGPSYTYDTVRALLARAGGACEVHLVVGADMLADLPKWYRAADLLELARVVVALRPPWDERMDEILAGLGGRLPEAAVERLRRAVVPTPRIDISSTAIRRRVGEGRSIRFLVPESVRRYIEARGLYRGFAGHGEADKP